MSFLNSLDNNSSKFSEPFDHWELNKPLTDDQIKEIIKAEIDNPIEHNIIIRGAVGMNFIIKEYQNLLMKRSRNMMGKK